MRRILNDKGAHKREVRASWRGRGSKGNLKNSFFPIKSQKRRRTASSGTKARQHVSCGVKGVHKRHGKGQRRKRHGSEKFVLLRHRFVRRRVAPQAPTFIPPASFPCLWFFFRPCSAYLPCCASRVPRKCLRARACSPCAASFRPRRLRLRPRATTSPLFWPRRTRSSKSSRLSACWTLPRWRMCACARAATWRMSARSH